ncbi:ribosome-associated protein [Propionibacterium cyclohexanicum]|uniref:Ribosomal silencing factor RsfS n=1 Tax=Propionibacterium cyclohexanicum TaxID=64702 RepID=A0A1H9SAB8_9ACTN|nr:ribosome silencing factor [Propionibacterium cyclohexanicum]SER81942.1 ribosome-associated protein [Propionibacterium cyclohexanicum]
MAATEHALEITRVAAQAASDKLAVDIVGRDVSEQLAIADTFLIVSGRGERQVGAIVDAIEDALLDVGEHTLRREGHGANRWVLLDYGDLVVHVFHIEDRASYGLERLWRDCPELQLPVIDHEEGAS